MYSWIIIRQLILERKKLIVHKRQMLEVKSDEMIQSS